MESGIVFAMVNAILFAYFRTEDEIKKRIGIIVSLSVGIVAAIISTIVRGIPNFINRTNLNFWSMVPVVVALIIILILAPIRIRVSDKNKPIFENVFMGFIALYTAASFSYYLPAIITLSNSFVYYGESPMSTMVLFRIIGFALGVTVMILSAIGVYKTATKLNPKEMHRIIMISMLLFGITQVFVIIQRLYSIKIIPRNDSLFNVIAWVANNTATINFIVMAFLAFLPVILFGKNIKIVEAYDNRAQLRKIKYIMKKKRHLAVFFMTMIIINVLSLTVVKAYAHRDIALSAPEDYVYEDGYIVIPLTDLEDGHIHRYGYTTSDGINMRFFSLKKSEGSYAVVLDACEICGPSGYFERGNDVVCKLCDVVMNRGTIGFKGGCNPIPIPYIVHDEKIKVDPKDLDNESGVFNK